MLSNDYNQVIAESRQQLLENPNNMSAVGRMARAFCAKGEYREALVEFERLAAHHRKDEITNTLAPSNPAYGIDTSTLHWLLGDRTSETSEMHGLAAGVLDGSIKYGDAGGGMRQGLLLYFMGITAKMPSEAAYALKYLRNRVEKLRKQLGVHMNVAWPCSVAQYLLGDVAFEAVMECVNHQAKLTAPDSAARLELGRRSRLKLALFYDGIRSRALGEEAHCLARMRECLGLEDASNSLESYLARDEVQKASL